MTGVRDPVIRTPDQRIRVFVSSTLRELAAERSAVRAAIEAMNLAPVMFELGARPHPPRDLYRSYLAQSDVFVGIYADSYGWVAPGEDISGLEDEYDLAPKEMPKLIYLKDATDREPRLVALIQRIKADDTVSYVSFSTSDAAGGARGGRHGDAAGRTLRRRTRRGRRIRPRRSARARPVHRDDRAAGGGRRGARAARSRGRAPGDTDRPRWDRQEPPGHRSRPPRRRPRRAGGVVRTARARHRSRASRRGDRGRPRGAGLGIPRHGRRSRARGGRSADAGGARQLRADPGCRAPAHATVHGAAARRRSS